MTGLVPDLMKLGAVLLGLLGIFLVTWGIIGRYVLESAPLAFQDEHAAVRELRTHESLLDDTQRLLIPCAEILGRSDQPGRIELGLHDLHYAVEDRHQRFTTANLRAETAGQGVARVVAQSGVLTEVAHRLDAAWQSHLASAWQQYLARLLGEFETQLRGRREQAEAEYAHFAASADLLRQRGYGGSQPETAETPALSGSTTAREATVSPALHGGVRAFIEARLAESAQLQRELQDLTDRTIALLDEARSQWLPQFDTLLEAGGAPAEQLLRDLAQANLQPLEPEAGTPSDGLMHEEIAQGEATAQCPAGCILRRTQRGYQWQNLVLRKAKVVVATNAAPAAAPGTGGT
jgi:hypothetical protein